MFVRRCAWHRKYNGHAKLLGVASWRGWNITFSDGMCRDCAAKARAEWQLPPSTRPAPPPRIRSLRPDFAFAAAVLVLGLVATFGVVVGPQGPAQQTARVDVTPAPADLGIANRAASDAAPADRAPGVTPRAPAPRLGTIVAEAPAATYRAPARPIRVVRASAKRPTAIVAYQPFERPATVEVARVPEKPLMVAAAWRPWPEAHAFQAP